MSSQHMKTVVAKYRRKFQADLRRINLNITLSEMHHATRQRIAKNGICFVSRILQLTKSRDKIKARESCAYSIIENVILSK
jgi:hypothetical protein